MTKIKKEDELNSLETIPEQDEDEENRQKEPIFEIHCCRKKLKKSDLFLCRVSLVRLEGVICCRTFFPITTKQQIGKKQNFLSSD